MAPERRTDPEDGTAYTYDELAEYYGGSEAYWETCEAVKKGKGKGKAVAEPKAKAKGKAKAKAEPEAKAKAKAKAK
eukprot:CAMPEP_0177552554 /NCGR_PEP_ID=MMETSP0369-20130122/66898_1 /TAXON_ID=447022 ORGANISM="Scrippsiella hangoei-like, Strain SHHI-4" /NCGR_SAMPLE_ID=MMETSP0369 /ASSEMBLY_ACC=CAM_ASM_000364 /LENGTH=75 /DNA_ID=CAMNT_0019038291 /DNA_START=28 /DNA_END=253 /DNA_ORIENTATION=+